MKRAKVIIKGNVQMAGFRTFIKNIADTLNVKGIAENLEDGSVRVICEGEEKGLNEFVKSLKENPPAFVRIEEVSVGYEEYKGEFSGFERRGADVPGEESEMMALMRSFDKKGEVMIGLLSSMNDTLKGMKQDISKILEKQDMMLEKQDMMLEKQDETIGAIREVSEKVDKSKEEIVTEIKSLREDLKSYMEDRLTRIEQEIEAIKAKIGMD